MTLGKKLKIAREDRDLYQAEVAEAIGSSKAVISNYERDLRDPDTGTLKSLAEFYNLSADYLLGIIDEPYPAKVDYDTYNKLLSAKKELNKHQELTQWWIQLPYADKEKLKKLKGIWNIIS